MSEGAVCVSCELVGAGRFNVHTCSTCGRFFCYVDFWRHMEASHPETLKLRLST